MSNTKNENQTKGMGWALKWLFLLFIGMTVLVAIAGGAVFWHFSKNLPEIITVADYRPLTVSRVYAAPDNPAPAPNSEESDAPETKTVSTSPSPAPAASPAPGAPQASSGGTLIAEFYKERRYVIPYDKIPQNVVHAFISAEDDQFFSHQGVNLASIIRAGIANFKAGHVVQGGSTITQQVAKSLLLTSERSFDRKIKELILSSRMERNLTKEQILYLYLNQIYLGHGAYGVQAATNVYFGKDVSQITVAEAAMLAGLPQAPGKYSPNLNPKRAKERQLYVLRRMYENRFITQAQMTAAAAEGLQLHDDEEVNLKYSGYFTEHVRQYLAKKYGDKAVYEDGLTVIVPTTAALLQTAKTSLRDGLRAVDKRTGYRGPIKNLKSEAEIEKELKTQRMEMIQKKLGYQLLTPEGKLDPIAALKHAGLNSDTALLQEGEIYRGVVTSFDDKAKSAGVLLGAVRAELPVANMKWAKRPEPNLPSKVLEKGDVILVKAVTISPERVVVSLEQEPAVQGALFSMDIRGNVLAMEGGYDFKQSEFNRAIQAQRQPGSAFKPMIFTAAIERGMTPASIIVDSPLVYEDADTGKWKPSNHEEKFHGDTTLRSALIKSRNIPTIKIVQQIGIPNVIDFARRLGMSAQLNNDLSISLGSGAVSLAELTKVYAVYPRLGRKVEPSFFTEIRNRDGKVLESWSPKGTIDLSKFSAPMAQPSPGVSAVPMLTGYPSAEDPEQVLDPRVAYIGSHLMKEVVSYGTGHDAKSLGKAVAGKTGTTNDYLDAWFMGYTPQVVTGVWVGYDNQKSMGSGETGAKAALPIWMGFMKEAVKKFTDEDFTVPPGVVFANIDPTTGKLAPANSSIAIREAFIDGTQPTETDVASGKNTKSQTEFFKEDIE